MSILWRALITFPLALAAGIVGLEAMLAVSDPMALKEGMRRPTPQIHQAPRQSKPEQPLQKVAAPMPPAPARRPPGCQSEYYALFRKGGALACARNPTPLLAHWGPPSADWFRLRGGEFQVSGELLGSPSRCACLEQEAPYVPEPKASPPISQVVYNAEALPIARWVCADRCNHD